MTMTGRNPYVPAFQFSTLRMLSFRSFALSRGHPHCQGFRNANPSWQRALAGHKSTTPSVVTYSRPHPSVARDENGQKRSVKGPTIFTFIFFHRKRKRYGIFGNENDVGIPVISETKIYSREAIDNDRNPSK